MIFPIKIRRNLEYENRNGEARYFFDVDLNEVAKERSSTLPVYWRPNKAHPILKEIYSTEIGGFRLEKGNLAALADAVPGAIKTLVDHGTLPYYSISLPDGSKIPVYLVAGRLLVKINGVQIEGSDIGELYPGLVKQLVSSRVVKSKNEAVINLFLWKDLKLYPPAFVFRDNRDKVWIPVFLHEKGELNYDIINQPHKIFSMSEIFELRKEIATTLKSSKLISSPEALCMDQVKAEVWKALKKRLKAFDQCFIYETSEDQKMEIPVYRFGSELIAVNNQKIYFNQTLDQLRSTVAEGLKKDGLISSVASLKIAKMWK